MTRSSDGIDPPSWSLRVVVSGVILFTVAWTGGACDGPAEQESAPASDPGAVAGLADDSSTDDSRPEVSTNDAIAARGSGAEVRPSGAGGAGPVVLFFGTSLTAGYGLEGDAAAFPAVLQEKMDSAGLDYRVVNAGVPGETSAAGIRRIGWVLDRNEPDVVVLELGANDGLRGQDPDALRANLEAAIDSVRAHAPDADVVLAGMEAPPNLGPQYTEAFRAVFREVARSEDVVLVPFLLEDVAGVPELNQDDRIHPTAEGHRIVAENVWPVLEPVLEERGAPGER